MWKMCGGYSTVYTTTTAHTKRPRYRHPIMFQVSYVSESCPQSKMVLQFSHISQSINNTPKNGLNPLTHQRQLTTPQQCAPCFKTMCIINERWPSETPFFDDVVVDSKIETENI